ncbi:hypothetical protein HK100_011246 [Physocladia obscura]|uniref:Uncharacterized protein n=1 Tax=Physocladia obscura TaxID=109957 RepID=A0AAD5T255_9FUNG|nr:hypothetical protein HK100_011246 [Physocladia obscura]
MDKRTTKKQRAVALTQDVRILWANQSRTQSGASHQNNTSQALTDDTQYASPVASIPANTTDRRAILPSLSPDPDLNDYPFVPDQTRVIGLDLIGIFTKTVDVMDVVVPESYEGVTLTKLGAKNYVRLFNPITSRIVEPPEKNCKECEESMDWRIDGGLQKRPSEKHAYQTACVGSCRKKYNDDPDIGNPKALQSDKEYKAGLAEKTRMFGAGFRKVEAFVAENHPTTGNLVNLEKDEIAKKKLAGLVAEEGELRKAGLWNQRESERLDIARKNAMAESHNLKGNACESKHISQRKWAEKAASRRKGIAVPDLPLADVLLEHAPNLQEFVDNHSGLSAAFSNPSNTVSVDTAAKNRSRQGVDLISFSSYSHKSKTWFFAYVKGTGWQVNRWRSGPNSFQNPAFTISKTEHTVNETMALYVEFVDGCIVLGFEGNDELRINSWLRSGCVVPRTISYSTHGALSIFGEHGIVKTPDSVLTNIVKRLFEDGEHAGLVKPVLMDMTCEVAAKQPISDPTVDAMRLFNLIFCLYEVLLRYHDEGDVDE